MKRFAAASLALVAMTNLVLADGKKLLVLQSEGKADARTRSAVDAAIVKLARSGGDTVTPGDITYSDAAAMVGCKPEETACRDEVIASLGVDEIVITTVTPKGAGFDIAVKRAAKGNAKDAAVTVTSADKLDALGPLFGAKTVGPDPVKDPTKIGPNPPVDPSKDPTKIGPNPPDPAKDPTKITQEPPQPDPTKVEPVKEPTKVEPQEPAKTAQPLEQPAGSDAKKEKRRHYMRIGGMAGGGGLLLLSFILWGKAESIEGDVDSFVVRSRADLEALRDKERSGAAYASWGNLLFLGGLGLGGVSTYYYFKARKKNRQTPKTAIAPMLFEGGGGISVTIGGLP